MSNIEASELKLLQSQIAVLIEQNKAMLEKQELMANTIHTLMPQRTFSIKDLAERYGVHTNTLYNCPWRLPNYGKSDFEFGKTRWTFESVMNWEKKSAKEHEADWARMTVKERKEVLGVA